MQLNQDWTIIGSVEGGKILAKNTDGKTTQVKYPEYIDLGGIRDLLTGLDIEFGDEVITLEDGPSETIAVFFRRLQPIDARNLPGYPE